MVLFTVALILSLLADAGITYAIYASGANPWFCLFGLIIWLGAFIVLFGIWILIIVIWGAALPKDKPVDRPSRFYYGVIRQTLQWLFIFLNVHVHYRGEHLPNEKFLLICNHRSNFDQMALIGCRSIKEMVIFITKPENLSFPIAGPFIRHAGFIPINRDNMTEGVETIHKASSFIKDGVTSIGVSPEGTRNKTDELLLPFKPGSFHIGTDVKAPVVVACIKNAEKVSKNAPFRSTHIYIDILRVVPASEYEAQGLNNFVAYCESIVRRDLEEGDLLLDLSFD